MFIYLYFYIRFLRGECVNVKCLLSHDVSLSKMPVCKFYMQGVCVRNDCPYLHKKLSNNAEVCIDFLRGFCQLADKVCYLYSTECLDVHKSCIIQIFLCIRFMSGEDHDSFIYIFLGMNMR